MLQLIGVVFPFFAPMATAAGVEPRVAANLVAVLLLAYALLRAVGREGSLPVLDRTLSIWLFAFALWMAIATALSRSPEISVKASVSYYCFVASFVSINSLIDDRDRLKTFGSAIVAGGVLYAAVILLETLRSGASLLDPATFVQKSPLLGINRNSAALPLILPIPMLAAEFLFDSAKPSRLIGILLMGVALLLTASRSAWLAVGISGLLLGGLWVWRRRGPGLLLGGAAAVTLLLLALLSIHGLDDLQMILRLESGTTGRGHLWLTGLRIIDGHPFTGVGPGLYDHYKWNFLPATSPFTVQQAHGAHNLFIHKAAEMGVPMAALIFALFCYLIGRGRRLVAAALRPGRSGWTPLELACLATVIGSLVRAFFENGYFIGVGHLGDSFYSIVAILVLTRRSTLPTAESES